MVSKASEDFPEPDSPVNTTSLSRGISRSTFLRLCSRAPRIVIARVAEPFCWRLALITSSISAIPGALTAPRSGAYRRARPGSDANELSSEHRKNGTRFPVFSINHQRFVGSRSVFKRKQLSNGGSRQQPRLERKQKGRRKAPALSN